MRAAREPSLATNCHREPASFAGVAIHATSSNTKARCRSTNRRNRCDSLHGLLRRKLLAMTTSVGTRVPVRPGVPPAFKRGRLGSRPHHHLSSRAGAVYRLGDPCRVD